MPSQENAENEVQILEKYDDNTGGKNMKKIVVETGCIACGACFALSNLLEENSEGKAVVVGKGYVDNVPSAQIHELIAICPVKTITVVEDRSVSKDGIKKKLDALKGYRAPQPNSSECPFRKEEYRIDIPSANGEYRYDYSSYSRAERAGLEEFDRQMYSQKEKIVRKIFTEYRVKYLRQYYEYEKNENNYYYRIELVVNKLLNDVACDIEALTGKKVPENLKRLEAKPNTKDEYYGYVLKHFEDGWVVSGAMKHFKESPYRLDDYTSYIDVDDMERYESGIFGRSKEVTKYCYRKVREAFEELAKDIRSACYYAYDFYEIDFSEMKSYTEKVNAEIQEKAIKLQKLVVDSPQKTVNGETNLKKTNTASENKRQTFLQDYTEILWPKVLELLEVTIGKENAQTAFYNTKVFKVTETCYRVKMRNEFAKARVEQYYADALTECFNTLLEGEIEIEIQ